MTEGKPDGASPELVRSAAMHDEAKAIAVEEEKEMEEAVDCERKESEAEAEDPEHAATRDEHHPREDGEPEDEVRSQAANEDEDDEEEERRPRATDRDEERDVDQSEGDGGIDDNEENSSGFNEEEECADGRVPPPVYMNGGYSDTVFEKDVLEPIRGLKADTLDFLVIAGKSGYTPPVVLAQVVPYIPKSRRLSEIVLVDLITDEIVAALCAAIKKTPSVTTLRVISTGSPVDFYFSMNGVEHLCALIATCPTLHNVYINNILHHLVDDATDCLARALYPTRIQLLNLECNSIHDAALLPLARSLAAQSSIQGLNLANNNLGYEGLEMLTEVMNYNRTLVTVNVGSNRVRIPTDTWEGFFIAEQCKVNKELARLGEYARTSHGRWPHLFRRKMRKLWYIWKKLADQPSMQLWEEVLKYVDPKKYVNQKVRLWMREQNS
ncbi:FERM domain-containing protein C [Diplonema papillatum]|nr:FERM domain-containing protein C [Diplonema papillatum]